MSVKTNDLLCCCEYCNDGDGESVFPYYGLAPHKHDMTKTGSVIGSTVIDDKSTWPVNFSEDPEAPGCGTYCYCPECGRPNNEELHYKDIETRKMRTT